MARNEFRGVKINSIDNLCMGLKFDTFNKILNHKTWLVPSVHALMGVSISFFHRDLICSKGGKLPSLCSLKTFASPRYIRRPKPPPFPLTKTQLATNSLTCFISSIKLPFSICSAISCTTLWRGHVCLWHKVSEKRKTRKRKKEKHIVENLLMILAAMLTMPVSFFFCRLKTYDYNYDYDYNYIPNITCQQVCVIFLTPEMCARWRYY